MAIITFSLTRDELLSGQKTVTRRAWKRSHMVSWQRWYDEGKYIHDAYDRIPIAGGSKIAEIRLTERPYWEALKNMPEDDLAAEGGMAESLEQFYDLVGLSPSHEVAVVRFELIEAKAVVC